MKPKLRAAQSQKFERIAADPGKQWDADGFSALISWEKLAAESKGAYIAAYAAVYEVSFERFAEAARNALGGQDVPQLDPQYLRGQFEGSRILLGGDDRPAQRIEYAAYPSADKGALPDVFERNGHHTGRHGSNHEGSHGMDNHQEEPAKGQVRPERERGN